MKLLASVALPCVALAIFGVGEASGQLEPKEAFLYFWEEGPGPVTPPDDRVSATLFDAARSRYIGFNLALHYPAPGAAVTYPVSCRYIKPDGSLVGSTEIEFKVEPNSRRLDRAGSLGWDEPGGWAPGTYRARCSAGSRLLVERTFHMTAHPPDLAGIRFFDQGDRSATGRTLGEATFEIG